MTRMTVQDFEARYRQEPDPWSYETSDYERVKYQRTLAACGPGPFSAALELGCSIGVFTALLAERCQRLVAIDGSATALQRAQARLADDPHVHFALGAIPSAIPESPCELVIASEILYYLDEIDLTNTLRRLRSLMMPGCRLVAVHWRSPGPERPLSAEYVHRLVSEQRWLRHVDSRPDPAYLLDIWDRG